MLYLSVSIFCIKNFLCVCFNWNLIHCILSLEMFKPSLWSFFLFIWETAEDWGTLNWMRMNLFLMEASSNVKTARLTIWQPGMFRSIMYFLKRAAGLVSKIAYLLISKDEFYCRMFLNNYFFWKVLLFFLVNRLRRWGQTVLSFGIH